MAIYPDKKDGKLTGRFRVELQRGKARHRKRWNTYAEAEADEKAVVAHWDAEQALPVHSEPQIAPTASWTFDNVIPLAQGMLWEGTDTEDLCWARIEIVADMLGRQTVLDTVDTHKIDGLHRKLRAAQKADGTINRYMSHLKVFLTWAAKRGYRTKPVADIEFGWKKESAGRIRWITFEEEATIGEYLTGRTHEKSGQAAAVWKLIQVAIATGCRRDELLTAELDQIGDGKLHLWETKTDTPRTVPMTRETQALLVDLIQSGTMPTRRGLRSWWQRVREHMDLLNDADFVFHACRHTCATRMVDAGVNIVVIKEWMGHKVIETTLRYAHVKPSNLVDALAKVGDYQRRGTGKSQFSAVPTLPHTAPHGGENALFQEAA